jgi:tetratricopeptide (TPR) repeat protein
LDADPDSLQASRDVAVSLIQLADFLRERGQDGDVVRAFGCIERSLELSQARMQSCPGSELASRDVSIVLNRLADYLLQRGRVGDAELALDHIERSLDLREALLRAEPDSAQALRDVSESLGLLADFLRRRRQDGDVERALNCAERSLALRERLLKANPDWGLNARHVAVSLDKLADFLRERGQAGDVERALCLIERGLSLREGLLRANPESARAARDVSVSLDKLADFLRERGQDGDAACTG